MCVSFTQDFCSLLRQLPQHLWPWVACHAPLKQGQRSSYPAKISDTSPIEGDVMKSVGKKLGYGYVMNCWLADYFVDIFVAFKHG